MIHRASGALRRALMLKPRNAGVLIGMLAVFGAALPAVAEPGRGGCHRNLGLRGRADCHGARGTGEQGNRGTGVRARRMG